ncbi:Propionyl-CoA carboxylase beta chain [Candidatus Xenohaliotis californiensis]|uniref:Propionyl-CoA carboxylase beta chain n=1 Tax=Candidatus Xenohaliotis californiensis TaxID=84677 RepID=A0ABP0ETE1_9RICK|nr:Propionyl-CoA carboxylase beta chain [Candidatus Xenohaliotis californiensis]
MHTSTIQKKRNETLIGGGKERVVNQHKKGKLTARERIKVLLDKNSFEEYGVFAQHRCDNFNMDKNIITGDGVVTGVGKINGKTCFTYAQDFTVFGGSLGEMHAKKICNLMDMAAKAKAPLICINDSGGARIQEGIDSLAGYGDIFQRNVNLSGVIPQISLIMGPCAGGAVYSPALTDFIFMTCNTSFMFVTGPAVVKSVTYEQITTEKLGGASVHDKKTGIVDAVFNNDIELLTYIRKFMRFIPNSNKEVLPVLTTTDTPSRPTHALEGIIPSNPNTPYDIRHVISIIADENQFTEIQQNFATNIVIGFAHMNGTTVGIVANQPNSLAGCLDINASRKAARFIRFCDAFNIPIVTLVDVPGFLPGTNQEHNAIIKHGAKLAYAYAEATVPKITIALRKAYGGAYIAMGSKHLGGDINYALQDAEIAVMGPKGAVEIIFSKHVNDPEKLEILTKEYRKKFATPITTASRCFLDDIISSSKVRFKICYALEILKHKSISGYWKKHDNLPL